MLRFECFGENRIGTGVQIRLRPQHGIGVARHASRIGSGDNYEIRISTRCHRRADFPDHHLGIDERFTGKVAAPLGHLLIFEVNARDTGLLEEANRAFDVQTLAEAGVGIAK